MNDVDNFVAEVGSYLIFLCESVEANHVLHHSYLSFASVDRVESWNCLGIEVVDEMLKCAGVHVWEADNFAIDLLKLRQAHIFNPFLKLVARVEKKRSVNAMKVGLQESNGQLRVSGVWERM